jgi:uncharacterized membrane protein YcaP (DUF421 family)
MCMENYLRIVFSSVAIYIFIIVAIRISGKKELAQLSVIDLVFILLISNAVQNAMVGPDTSLTGGLAAASALFIVNYLFKYLLYKYPKLGIVVQGHSLMLIYKGKVIDENARKAQVTMDELEETIREHGVSSIKEVDLAVLELDGNISVISHDFQHRTSKRRKGKHKTTQGNN